MFVFDFFRSFLPLHNPIGFGAGDFLELTLAALLIIGLLSWRHLEPYAAQLASRAGWSMLLLALLPVALRLLLLPRHPAPAPEVYDEFSHLLVADTLRHLRLANPPHPLPQFFETQFVLQEPTYSSIYPVGQGLALALGWTLFGHPWAGVLIAMAAFCALCYWMLRAWTTPGWALAGGLLAVIEFGPLSQWMNSYWGGGVAAAAGCLVFGALPRILAGKRPRDAALLGAGIGIHALTRPYESVFLIVSVLLFFMPLWRKRGELRMLARLVPAAALAVFPALGIVLLQNKQVTGNWTTLPYTLSQYQYGVPTSLTVQPAPVPHHELNREQALNYRMQASFRPSGGETLITFLERLEYRVRYYRFFFLAPLYLALPAFFWTVRRYRFLWVALALALFAIGTNFYPFFEPHYLAGATCLFVLVAITGLQQIGHWNAEASRLLFILCAAHFLFWYGLHVAEPRGLTAIEQYETWDALGPQNPSWRSVVNAELFRIPGKLLVFVRYWPQHLFQDEWVYNRADIDGSRVVWARDLGPAENQKILTYYKDRSAWLLEPDFRPPRFTRYSP